MVYKRVLVFLGCLWATCGYASISVSPKPYVLFSVGSFPITNGMLYTWFISLVIVFVVHKLVGVPKLVPTKGQAIVENLVSGIYEVIEPVVGKQVAQKAFPLLMGFFMYILIQNWSGLLPGVGTIGYYEQGHFKYFFRPSNTDLNATLALASISLVAWLFFIVKYVGFKGVIMHIFGNKANRNEVSLGIYGLLFFIFLGVGVIECISIAFRLVSLSFRLYGNMFGGESLLNSIMDLAPWTKFFVPIPFYFLEVLTGAIQALVFTILTAVYIGSICKHDDETVSIVQNDSKQNETI